MKRAIILKYVMVKAMATPPLDELTRLMDKWSEQEKTEFNRELQERTHQQTQQLRATGLWNNMDSSEQALIEAGSTEISMQARIDASWLAESAVCLLWALGYISELPGYDQQADPELTNTLPVEPVANLVKMASLRPPAIIEKQRDLAELWNWRSRTRRLQESGEMPAVIPGGGTIEHVIHLASAKAAEDGAFPVPINGDFPAFKKAYRDLTFEEFSAATSIAQERHRAFNWLCGYAPGNRWPDTPTDT